jgi:hypothetical protein
MTRISFFILISLFLSVSLSGISVKQADFNKYFRLLPQPQKIEILTGKALTYNDLRFINLEGTEKRPLLDHPLNGLPVSDSPGRGVLTLSVKQDNSLPESPEGYVLLIKDKQAVITSKGEAGLFYGCQTLLQLLEDSHDQQVDIPPCRITDYPGLPYRAIHLDIRFHLDAGHFYYELIDRLARIKVNAIILELEDKLRYKRAPLVGSANSISIDEFAAISRYAKERNIDISPLVQGLGHAGHILKHDEYKHLRDNPESDWAFDALNPGTYDLQFDLYRDAMEATPYGKYLHVGGDEVYNLGQSELAKKSGMKPVELQLYWLNKVSDFVNEHGRIPICWDDMFFSLAGLSGTMRNNPKGLTDEQIEAVWKENQYKLDGLVDKFPDDCIYMRWTYWNTKVKGNLKAIDWLISQNLRVMGATAAQDMSPLLPRNNSIFNSIKDFNEIASEKKLDGILCTMWDDSSYSFETFWRGIFNFASMSWNYEDIEAKVFNNIFRHRFYSPELSDPSFEFQNLLEQALWFWDGSLINNSNYARHISKEGVYNPFGDRGDRRVHPKNIELISLPDPENPGQWCEKYKEKISQAKTEASRYLEIKKKITEASMLARRNHYSLRLMDKINEFQAYSFKLILLLEKYDRSSSPTGRQAAASDIIKHVESFSEIRGDLENVISEKRFLKNPDGYVRAVTADLANGGINNEWMFVHETPMNEKITDWLKK